AVLIGHDWGAFAAYAAANLEPSRFAKLVTLAIPHPGVLSPSPRTMLKARHFLAFQLRGRAIAALSRNDFAGIDEIYQRWWRASATSSTAKPRAPSSTASSPSFGSASCPERGRSHTEEDAARGGVQQRAHGFEVPGHLPAVLVADRRGARFEIGLEIDDRPDA